MPDITDGSWLRQDALLGELGLAVDEDGSVNRARLAAVAQVEQARPDLLLTVGDVVTFEPTHDVLLAGFLLAKRLHARKNSPTGLASYGEFGPAAVLRFDPDVERLLGIGRYGKPQVG